MNQGRQEGVDNLKIYTSGDADVQDILDVLLDAFGEDEVPLLVDALLHDDTAKPAVSLIASIEGRAVGYILFTRAVLRPQTDQRLAILAPLAVIPAFQNLGVGGKLISAGVDILVQNDVSLAFVLGYPDYYTRYDFEPARGFGLYAPYPIAEKNSDAWMVRELQSGVIGSLSGTVHCAETMDHPQYWLE